MRDSHQIAVPNIFLLVGQSSHPPVDLRELRIAWLVAQIAQAQAQRIASGMLPKYQGPRWDSHGLRRNDLVRQRVLDNTILVDSRFVRKSIRAHYGFIRRNCRAGNFRKHAASGEKLLEADSRADSKTVLAHGESNHDLFQCRVAGPLPDAVDC